MIFGIKALRDSRGCASDRRGVENGSTGFAVSKGACKSFVSTQVGTRFASVNLFWVSWKWKLLAIGLGVYFDWRQFHENGTQSLHSV